MIQSVNVRLGEYIDYFLQPLVPKTSAYLRDTKHLIQTLNEIEVRNEQLLLETADVSSFYTIINHDEALQSTLDSFSELASKQKSYILKCLEYGLHQSYFWHNSDYYKQIKGIAMGVKFAPSMANLFMAKWEEELVFRDLPPELVLYKRYIDDLIVIWTGDVESLTHFFSTTE